jgi:hypothetical protein
VTAGNDRICILALKHSPLDAKGGDAIITDISYNIRDALNRVAEAIKNQRFKSAQAELNSVFQSYGRSQEFTAYRNRFSELENQMNASMKAANASYRLVFDKIVLTDPESGRHSNHRETRLPFSGTIYIDPTIPLEEALNQWLQDHSTELLKTLSANPQQRLFVEYVIFINKEENRYQDSRRNRRLLSTPAGELNLRSTYSKMYVTIR